MSKFGLAKTGYLLPAALGLAALAALALWLGRSPDQPLALRVPGTDQAPGSEQGSKANPVLAGKVTRAEGQPADLPGAWPQFRGPERDGISRETVSLARTWQPGEPRQIWSVDVGEGYAGAAIFHGRVYVMDYDRDKKQDALRCLSLADGREIWRYAALGAGQAQSRHVAHRAGLDREGSGGDGAQVPCGLRGPGHRRTALGTGPGPPVRHHRAPLVCRPVPAH